MWFHYNEIHRQIQIEENPSRGQAHQIGSDKEKPQCQGKGPQHSRWRFIMTIDREKVKQALEKTRNALQSDGGDIELVEVTDEGIVQVRLKGACSGCPMATITMKSLIERVLKKEIPEITGVQEIP